MALNLGYVSPDIFEGEMTANTMRLIVNRQEADAIRAGLQMLKTRDLRGGFPKDTLVNVITLKKSLCKLSNEKIDELCDLLDFEKSGSHSNDDLASVMENILAKYLEHGSFRNSNDRSSLGVQEAEQRPNDR